MADSFADLWNASAPPSSSSTPSAAASSSASRTKPDVFALLASSSSNGTAGGQRYGTPSNLTSTQSTLGSRPITPSARSKNTTPAPSSTSKPNSGDAFGDLLSSLNTGTKANANGAAKMTLAARLAHEAEERRRGSSEIGVGPSAQQGGGGTWAGLDILDGGGRGTVENKVIQDDDDWGLGDFGSSTSASTSKLPPVLHTTEPIPHRPGVSLLDLDEFAKDQDRDNGVVPRVNGDVRAARLLDLDFHDAVNEERPRPRERTQGLLDSDESGGEGDRREGAQEEDDILGMLSRPVDEVKVKRAQAPSSTLSPPPTHPTQRVPSPPPHILGQIVEMGFSVAQAKKALADTPSGIDVSAAVETLLGGGAGSSAGPASAPVSTSTTPSVPQRERTRGPPKGQKERERERLERQRRLLSGSDSPRETVLDRGASSSSTFIPTSTIPVNVAEIQGQADKLISQASEIGISVLGRASAFWKEGKERVGRVYEERVASSVGERGGSRQGGRLEGAGGGGRPRWMQDVRDGEDDGEGRLGGFKDNSSPVDAQEPLQHLEAENVDLFPPKPNLDRRPLPPRIAPASAPTPTPSRTQPPLRSLPSATPSTALQHKITGTAQFKLGQYAAACEAYSQAIATLPRGHLLLVPLYTNRALGRLKTGEYREAEVDAEKALEVICGDESMRNNGNASAAWKYPWSPAQEHPSILNAAQNKVSGGGWTHPQGLGVDLVDGYVKAVKRRSEALEGREKWEEAGRGWEILSAAWVGEAVRKESLRGAGRCRGMVGGSDAGTSPASKSATASTSTTPVSRQNPRGKLKLPTSTPSLEFQQPSAALLALRNATAQADADDALKHQLKDSVDSRLGTWRKGKEGNIRALLASLDLVLWEELLSRNGGGKGVGIVKISELVTPAQVKKGYMRVIGKVHPDKLNPSNSTVEQRMLANGVFGTLNDAWVSFQGQGG